MKKIFIIVLAMATVASLSLLSATGVNAANTVSYGTIGTGASTNLICPEVELSTPAGLTGSGFVRLNIDGGIALNAISSLSYTAKVTVPGAGGFAPEVVLNIDADSDGAEGAGIDWMLSGYNPATLNGDNFLSGDNWPASVGVADGDFVNRDALTGYNYWSANDARTGFGSFWTDFASIITGTLPAHDIDATDLVHSIDFVVGTSGNFDGMTAIFSSVELNGTTYPVASCPEPEPEPEPCGGCVKGDDTVINKNYAFVGNQVEAEAETGGNTAGGSSGGNGGNGGNIKADGDGDEAEVDDSTTGNGGNGAVGGDGGIVVSGNATALAGAVNIVNTSRTVIDRCGCGRGDCQSCDEGDVKVINRSVSRSFNKVEAEAETGDNTADGSSGGNGGNGGNIKADGDGDEAEVDDSDTGSGGTGAPGGLGGEILTGDATAKAGVVNIIGRNRTLIRR